MKAWYSSLLPFPLRSIALLLIWLLLNQSLHPAHWALGAVFAVALPLAFSRLWPRITIVRNAGLALRLLGRLLADIVVSNIEVARRILGPEAALQSRFMWMPLAIENPQGVAVLAAMITMTPGTLAVDVTPDRRWLLIHGLNIADEAAVLADIRDRYESPLREIFT